MARDAFDDNGPGVAPDSSDSGPSDEDRFRRFAVAKFVQLLAQYALIYGLFIAVISRQGSSLSTSAFVLASILPSILLSLPGGLGADMLPKKLILVGSSLLRLVIVFFFLDSGLGLAAVLFLTLLSWSAFQFFTPAESAALPAIVSRKKLDFATSALQAISLVAQLGGAGIVAPLTVEFLGLDGLFMAVLLLLLVSILLYLSMPNLTAARAEAGTARVSWWRALPKGIETIQADTALTRLTALRVFVDTGTLILVVAAPAFIEKVLNTGSANAVYLATPAALGLALGLLSAPALLTVITTRTLAAAGFVLFVGSILLLPFVRPLSDGLFDLLGFLDWLARNTGLSREIVLAALILPWTGLGISLVQVSARAIVYRRVRPELIAQVFAAQSGLSSLTTLLPTFAAGAILDLLPVEPVLAAIAGLLAVLALLLFRVQARPAARSRPVQGTSA